MSEIIDNPTVMGAAVLTVLSTLAYNYFKYNNVASNESECRVRAALLIVL